MCIFFSWKYFNCKIKEGKSDIVTLCNIILHLFLSIQERLQSRMLSLMNQNKVLWGFLFLIFETKINNMYRALEGLLCQLQAYAGGNINVPHHQSIFCST